MSKVSKLGVALVFSLLLVLAVSTTSGFAQSVNRNVDRSNISALTHAAVLKNVAQGIVSGIQHPNGNCNGGGWGGGWNGGGGCGNSCGGGGVVLLPAPARGRFPPQGFFAPLGYSSPPVPTYP